MTQKLLAGAMFLAVTPLMMAHSAAAISLDFAIPSNVEVGQQIDIGIVISDLGNASSPSLGGFDFNVNFDSSILSFDSRPLAKVNNYRRSRKLARNYKFQQLG